MQQQIHSAAPIESLKQSAASVLLLHRWGGSCFRLWSKTWSWFRLAEAPAEKKSLSIPVTEIDTKKKREEIVASSPDVVYFGGKDVRSEKTMGFRCRNGDLNNVLIESLLWRKLVFFAFFSFFFRICFHLFGENEGQRYAIQERFKRSTVNPYRWVLSSSPSKLQISQQLFGGEGCCSGWIFPGNSDQLRDCFFLDTRRLVNHQPHTSHFGKRCWIGQQC